MADNSFRRFTNTRLETPRQLSYVIRVTICYLTSYHSAYKPDDIKPRFCFANPLKSSHVIGMFHCLFIVSEILAARTVSIPSLNLFHIFIKLCKGLYSINSIYIIIKYIQNFWSIYTVAWLFNYKHNLDLNLQLIILYFLQAYTQYV